MKMVRLFSLKLKLPPEAEAPFHLFALMSKDELFISASSRLCSSAAMAHIESKELAEEFKDFCMPKFQDKYGEDVKIEVVSVEVASDKGVKDKMQKDSSLIKDRLAKARFN